MSRSLYRLLLFILMIFMSGCEAVVPGVSGSTYYVDCNGGDDANPGTSASRPWHTLGKVNAIPFTPGDGVFFKRDSICPGTLQPQGSGEAGRPITIGAYGRGARPTIAGGQNTNALLLKNQSYWHIQDLEITGGSVYGLHIKGDAGKGVLNHFRLSNLVVRDVNGGKVSTKVSGLAVFESGGENNTFNDVIIDGVTAYNTNQWGGIVVAGLSGDYRANPPLLSTNIIIRNSTVHNVFGDGIVLWGVQNGLIETSVAYETGLQPPPQTIGTPSSIWTWMCHDCTVQYNESYAAHSPDVDGGAYDVDWGTVNNLYQYNYGHDTDSYCISVFGAGGLTSSNAIIRYNVCTNNGRDPVQATAAGAILLTTWGGGSLDGVKIYNNTIYWNPENNSNALVNQATFQGTRPNFFKNNIVYSTAPWILFSNKSLAFDHNIYWYAGSKNTIWAYGDEGYGSFSEYRDRSGQDAHSLFADPLLRDITYHKVGSPKTAFSLIKGSPAIDAGTDTGDMGLHDFFGNPIPAGTAYDIGAYEQPVRSIGYVPVIRSGSMPPDLWLANIQDDTFRLSDFTGHLVLLSFLDPLENSARSQMVFLRSMVQQYSRDGMELVVVIPQSSAGRVELVNFIHDWGLESIPVLVDNEDAIQHYSVSHSPVTFLIDRQGGVLQRWEGLALPYPLAQGLSSARGINETKDPK
jgi:peroxiredoxin